MNSVDEIVANPATYEQIQSLIEKVECLNQLALSIDTTLKYILGLLLLACAVKFCVWLFCKMMFGGT